MKTGCKSMFAARFLFMMASSQSTEVDEVIFPPQTFSNFFVEFLMIFCRRLKTFFYI